MTAPDAVEAAARAMAYVPGLPAHWGGREFYLLATAALAAAAPLIAQQTLLDAAEEMDLICPTVPGIKDQDAYSLGFTEAEDQAAARLTARAATLTPKEN